MHRKPSWQASHSISLSKYPMLTRKSNTYFNDCMSWGGHLPIADSFQTYRQVCQASKFFWYIRIATVWCFSIDTSVAINQKRQWNVLAEGSRHIWLSRSTDWTLMSRGKGCLFGSRWGWTSSGCGCHRQETDQVLYLCSAWVSRLITPFVSAFFPLLLFLPHCTSYLGALYCTSDLSPAKDLSSSLTSIQMQSQCIHTRACTQESIRTAQLMWEGGIRKWNARLVKIEALVVRLSNSQEPFHRIPECLTGLTVPMLTVSLKLRHQLRDADFSF